MSPLLLSALLACGAPDDAIDDAIDDAAAPAVDAAPAARVDHQAELPAAPTGEPTFSPPARGAYPDGPFGDAVRRGEALFMDPASAIPEHVGNPLSCSNCHLDDGRRADSAPMWAAWGMYPAYRKKNDRVNSMEERLRGCFTYSLNAQASPSGQAPAPGDPRLTDLQAYVYWMAAGAPTGQALPGRGYPKLAEPEGGVDAGRGAAVYAERCAVCHGEDGQGRAAEGEVVFPPLWGPDSYNWGAGMHRINTAAGFIWANMPLGQPETLTEREAWDVAAFINGHDRPADPRDADGLEATDAAFHAHSCSYGDEGPSGRLGDR